MHNETTEISSNIHQAVKVLKSSGLVAFPTETVYGLGANARDCEAVKRIFEVKGRPSDHPVIVHISKAEQMHEWAQNIPAVAWQLAKAFWPGPLTLILPRLGSVSNAVTGGLDTVALRVPEHPIALALLNAFGSGIAAPSANRYGRVSPTSSEDVREELGDSVDLILDGGRCSVGIESTIIDLSTRTPKVLRPGKITDEELNSILDMTTEGDEQITTRCPGDKSSHYAPNTRVVLSTVENLEENIQKYAHKEAKTGLLSPQMPPSLTENIAWLEVIDDIEKLAHELYSILRQADHRGLHVLIIVMPEDEGIGHAVRDRLRRAAGLGAVI